MEQNYTFPASEKILREDFALEQLEDIANPMILFLDNAILAYRMMAVTDLALFGLTRIAHPDLESSHRQDLWDVTIQNHVNVKAFNAATSSILGPENGDQLKT